MKRTFEELPKPDIYKSYRQAPRSRLGNAKSISASDFKANFVDFLRRSGLVEGGHGGVAFAILLFDAVGFDHELRHEAARPCRGRARGSWP